MDLLVMVTRLGQAPRLEMIEKPPGYAPVNPHVGEAAHDQLDAAGWPVEKIEVRRHGNRGPVEVLDPQAAMEVVFDWVQIWPWPKEANS